MELNEINLKVQELKNQYEEILREKRERKLLMEKSEKIVEARKKCVKKIIRKLEKKIKRGCKPVYCCHVSKKLGNIKNFRGILEKIGLTVALRTRYDFSSYLEIYLEE